MTRGFNILGTIGVLAGALAVGGASSGCSSSKTSGPVGTGGSAGMDGSVQGSGGTAGSGGTVSSGGVTSTGGIGSGGIGSGGAGGIGTGGIGSGGIASGGAGGKATGGAGSGGIGSGGIAAGGAGGKATGGAGSGGIGSGGITSLDAGTCTGASCASDAGPNDATPGDVPAATCNQITTQAACDIRGDCHSVYVDPGTCGCASPGCCAHFDHCADGGKANCTGPALCKAATPFCEAPYVVSYTGSCYEGCVHQNECPPPICPQTPPANAVSCGAVDFSCFYEDCAGAGRTQAVCSAGTWQVQTSACSTVTCMGGGITTTTLTCAAGQLCVRTTSGGGAYMIQPSCVTNTCAKGPISPQCIQGLSGSCSGSYSLSGVQINCSLPSSCGQGQGGCS
jgi:hypothetical protein